MPSMAVMMSPCRRPQVRAGVSPSARPTTRTPAARACGRGAIIGIIKELRRLFFPAYFGDPQLMTLPAENYVALLLERIETALTAQIALALPEDQSLPPPRWPVRYWSSCPASSRC